MSEDLPVLTRRRGSIKRRLTNIVTYIESIDMQNVDSAVLSEFKVRLSSLQAIWQDYQTVQDDIEIKCDEESLETHYQKREEFEESFFKASGKLKQMISDASKESEIPNMSSTSNNVNNVNHIDNNNIKLPTINLPKFNGKYTSWLEFKDLYISLIHNNTKINAIQKFHYLRASLDDGAAQVISQWNSQPPIMKLLGIYYAIDMTITSS